MKLRTILFCGFLVLASLRAQAGDVVDGIAAIVGEEIILISDIHKARAIGFDRFSEKKRLTDRELLEELIKERLLRQEIERLDIEVTPEELQQAMKGVLVQNRMTLPELQSELARKGISFEEYKHDLTQRIKMMRFMQQSIASRVDVTEEDIEAYQRRHSRQAKGQSEEEIRQAILAEKSKAELDSYLGDIRGRTYVEIK